MARLQSPHVLICLILISLGGVVGHFYGTHRTAQVFTELEYLNQANKITLGLELINLAKKGDYKTIVSSQENLMQLSLKILKNPESNFQANRTIIRNSLSKLRDYQITTYNKVDQDLSTLLESLQ